MQKLLVITGPTASGKTGLSIALAKHFNGEIICADSRTVYRGMDIGTAKVTASEMNEVPHYGLDLITPAEKYSVGDFKEYAEEKIKEVASRGKLPMLVGGTGLYISAVLENYGFDGDNGQKQFDGLVLVPDLDRAEVYDRINKRVDAMVENGLLGEVESLLKTYDADAPGMTGIGYKELIPVVKGKMDLQDGIDLLKRDSRRYAKRQMTWWRHHGDAVLVEGLDDAVQKVTDWLK